MNKIATIAQLMVSISANSAGLRKELDASKRQLARFQKDMPSLIPAGSGEVLMAAAAGMGALGVASLKMASQMETNRLSFETMLGSAEAAKKMLQDLATFGESTPYEFTSLVNVTKKMLGLGYTAEEIRPTLTVLGDAIAAVGGNDEALNSVVDAFAKIKAGGALAADQVNRITDAGLPAWQILAKVLNTDVATAMKMAEAKTIDVNTAMAGMMDEMSSRYGGAMKKMATTNAGIWSNISDVATGVMRDIGDELNKSLDIKDNLNKVLGDLTEFKANVKAVGVGQAIIDEIPAGGVALAAGAITTVFATSLIPAIANLRIALLSLGFASGPAGAVIAGLALLAGGAAYMGTKYEQTGGQVAATNAIIYDGIGRMNMAGDAAGNLAGKMDGVYSAAIQAAQAMQVFNASTGDIAGGAKNSIPQYVAPVIPPIIPSGGGGGSAGSGAGGKSAFDELKEKAKQTTESIEKEWQQLTKSELEQTDIWKTEQLTALEESKDANENYARDVTRVNEMYAQKRIEIARKEATGIAAAMEEINNVRQGVANYDRNTSGSAGVFQDIENERQARIKAINDTTANQIEKNKLIDQVNQQMWAKREQYEISGNALIDDLQAARNAGDYAAYTQLLNDENSAFLSNLQAQENMAELYRQTQADANKTWAETSSEIMATAYDGLKTGITDAIMGADSLGSALEDVGKNVLRMFVQWKVGQAMAALFGETTMAAQTAASIAAGAATAAAWAPAAAMVSLASFGANAAPAMAGITSTSVLAATLSAPVFATGGPISGPGTGTSDSILMWGSDGEYMLNAAATRSIGLDNLNYMNNTGRLPAFADGGLVTGPSLSSMSNRYTSASGISERILKKIGISGQSAAPIVTQNNYGDYNNDIDLDDVMNGLGRAVASAFRG